jgi:Tfp pilus assembly PilM family ATPase
MLVYTNHMSFFSLFEKPKRSIAFSIDNATLRFVSVVREKNEVQVVDHGSEYFGDAVISPEDEILDDAAFVDRLRVIVSEIEFGGTVPCANIVIPDHQAIMFHTHIAKESPRQMNDVIVDHLKTYCEAHDLLDITEYICEYDIILETDFGYDAHVTLVSKKYSSHLARLFKQAGVTIMHIETAHHAVAMSCLEISRGEGLVLVSFGKKQSTVAIMHADHLVSQEVVPMGEENIYRAVEKFLKVDNNYAKKIIERHGVLRTHPDNGLLSELYLELAPLYRSIDRQLVTLGQIPYKSLGYRFITDSLLVYGEGMPIKGLVPFLGEKTNLNAEELDVWAGHPDDRAPIMNLHAKDALTYAEPLSLALVYLT